MSITDQEAWALCTVRHGRFIDRHGHLYRLDEDGETLRRVLGHVRDAVISVWDKGLVGLDFSRGGLVLYGQSVYAQPLMLTAAGKNVLTAYIEQQIAQGAVSA